jgi:hypothetical protein
VIEMAEKTVAEKLLIKPGSSVWVSDEARRGLLGALPDGVSAASAPSAATTAIVFADDGATVRRRFVTDGDALARAATLWVLYPKGNKTDINRDSLWPILSEFGLRPVTQVSVDDTWSAVRFRPLQEGEAPFTGGR